MSESETIIYDAAADDETESDVMALAPLSPVSSSAPVAPVAYTGDQLDLIKQTVAAGTSDLEFRLFVEVCHLTGLNPFAHQIYAIMRNASEKGRDGKFHTVKRMTIQTGIDGYLAIAARTDAFAGMDDVVFDTEEGEHPTWARVTVYRLVQGRRMPFTATARWREYVQVKDEYSNGQKTGKKTPTDMWQRMPWTMLGKCVRALALRLAFPAELAGVYTAEEMMQADNPSDNPSLNPPLEPTPIRPSKPGASPAQLVPPSSVPTSAPSPGPTPGDDEPPTWPELGQAEKDLGLTKGEWVQTVKTVTGHEKLVDEDRRTMADWLKHRHAQFEAADSRTPPLETLSYAGA